MNRKLSEEVYRGLKILLLIGILVGLGLLIYRLVVLPAPATTGQPPEQGSAPDILDKLGPKTAVSIILVLVGLVAWVFYLFIQFGRRLAMRGYLGPLAPEAFRRYSVHVCHNEGGTS